MSFRYKLDNNGEDQQWGEGTDRPTVPWCAYRRLWREPLRKVQTQEDKWESDKESGISLERVRGIHLHKTGSYIMNEFETERRPPLSLSIQREHSIVKEKIDSN